MFYPPESFRIFSRVVISFCLFLLLILGIAEIFPIYSDDPAYINAAGLQRTRVEELVNSMIILEYLPPAEHTNAIAIIETVLPQLRQEQSNLQGNTASDIQSFVLQSQPAYLAIVAAAQSAITDPSKPVDPAQVAIAVGRKDGYRNAINELVTILVQHSEANSRALYLEKTSIVLLLAVCGVGYWIVLEGRMQHVIVEEAKEKAPEPTT